MSNYSGSYKTNEAKLKMLWEEQNPKAIGLAGDWGVGKTYLINSIKRSIFDVKPEEPKGRFEFLNKIGKITEITDFHKNAQVIYVSLIGAAGVDDLKRTILSDCFTGENEQLKTVSTFTGTIKKSIGQVTKGVLDSVLDLSLLIPVSGKIIIFDDIDRKSPTLTLDSFMDLVSELKKENIVQLIYNEDSIAKSEPQWEQLKAKIIDYNFTLTATSDDLSQMLPDNESGKILQTVFADLSLDNFRLAGKVAKPTLAFCEFLEKNGVASLKDFSFLISFIAKMIYLQASSLRKEDVSALMSHLRNTQEKTTETMALNKVVSSLLEELKIPKTKYKEKLHNFFLLNLDILHLELDLKVRNAEVKDWLNKILSKSQ